MSEAEAHKWQRLGRVIYTRCPNKITDDCNCDKLYQNYVYLWPL